MSAEGEQMNVKFFGVRGSYNTPDENKVVHISADGNTTGYGGNTSCVGFFKQNKENITIPLYIDAGGGLINAGKELMTRVFSGKVSKEFPILFTHLHPDHTEGFTFFAPNFVQGVVLHLAGMETLKKNIGSVLAQKMLPPTYPIEYKDLKSYRKHHVLRDGEVWYVDQKGSICEACNDPVYKINVMQAFAPSHPQQGALYYRITDPDTAKSVACIWDIESHIGGDNAVINFSKGADIMIHDTQYTTEEYENRKMNVQGFGHSTYEMAFENAKEAEVKTLISFHYNPAHTNEFLDNYFKVVPDFGFQFIPSHEGLTIEV
jgi:ribonuclease BN (tRNA processing enzyme)